jgi:hypothetical protein
MVFCFYNCSGHTVRKNCYSDLENCLKFKAEGREFAKILRSLKQFTVRGLYIFDPIFHCGLYCRVVNITDNLCNKQGNSSIFGPKIRGS